LLYGITGFQFGASPASTGRLREGNLCVGMLQPARHYDFEQVAKIDILRKLKQRFSRKMIRDVCLPVS
jgi:hypothetical protein